MTVAIWAMYQRWRMGKARSSVRTVRPSTEEHTPCGRISTFQQFGSKPCWVGFQWLLAPAFVAIMLFAATAAEAAPPSRIALVIGNSAYPGDPLQQAGNDAEAVGQALVRRGFSLVGGAVHTNVTAAEFRALIAMTVAARRAHPDAFVAVYFAGHGFTDKGHNYLVPIDAPATGEQASGDIAVVDFANALAAAGGGTIALFLDACRTYLPGHGQGLGDEPAPANSFIGFAAQFGTAAKEAPKGDLGFYAAGLVEALDKSFDSLDAMHLFISGRVLAWSRLIQAPVYRSGPGLTQPGWLSDTAKETAASRRPLPGLASAVTECAQKANLRLAHRTSSTTFTGHGILFRLGPDYDQNAMAAIAADCETAMRGGDHSPAILRGRALTRMVESNLHYRQGTPQENLENLAVLVEAAETGDGIANFMIVIAGERQLLGVSPDMLHDRMMAAAANADPLTKAYVAGLLWKDGGVDFRRQNLLPTDDPNGQRLFLEAALTGEPMAAGMAFNLPDSTNRLPLKEILRRARLNPSDYGYYIEGTSVHETLDLLSIRLAWRRRDWLEFSHLVAGAAPVLGRTWQAMAMHSEQATPPLAQVFAMAACIFQTGFDPDGLALGAAARDPEIARVLFQDAATTVAACPAADAPAAWAP